MRSLLWVALIVFHALGGAAQVVTNTTLPGFLSFVPHAYAYRLATHPTLPVIYLGPGCTPDSKNLVTFGLHATGNVLTNSLRTCDDYFTDDGKNATNLHYLLRPVVLPEQRLLWCHQPSGAAIRYVVLRMNDSA